MKSTQASALTQSVMEHYKKLEFADAIKIMLDNKEVFDPGDFHYNLGTLFLKQRNFVGARFHLEKALKVGRLESDAINNLETSKVALGVEEIESQKSFWSKGADTLYSIPVSYFITLGLLIGIVFLIQMKLRKMRDSVAFLMVLGLGFLPFVIKIAFFNQAQFAITFKEVELREGPASVFEVTRTLPQGLKIAIGEKTEGWVMVKSPVEYSGWAPLKDLGVL